MVITDMKRTAQRYRPVMALQWLWPNPMSTITTLSKQWTSMMRRAQRVSSGREQGTVAVAAPPVRNNNGRSSSTEASDMRAMMHQMTSLLTTMNNEKKAQPVVNQMRMPPMPMPMAPMPMPPPAMMPPCAQCGLVGHLASHCNTRMRRSIVCYNCGEPGHLSTACRQPPSGATLRRQGQGRPGQGRNNNRRAGQGVTCYRCGVPGHISPQCPQAPNGGGASSCPCQAGGSTLRQLQQAWPLCLGVPERTDLEARWQRRQQAGKRPAGLDTREESNVRYSSIPSPPPCTSVEAKDASDRMGGILGPPGKQSVVQGRVQGQRSSYSGGHWCVPQRD